jgi:glycerol-3-phosphate acyltransferase PlsY
VQPLTYASVALAAYLLGGIPFGLLIGRLHGVDIRTQGSGNIGATNVWRVLGRRWGLTCFALDALKGYLPVLAADRLLAGDDELLLMVAAFATVAGHVWTPYLRFKGGKGIATSAGAVLGLAAGPLAVALALWAVVFAVWRYVSLASIVAAVALPFAAVGLNRLSGGPHYGRATVVLLALLALVAVVRHRGNLQRLLQGTEQKMGKKKESVHEDRRPQ